jgi:hypothetical protein
MSRTEPPLTAKMASCSRCGNQYIVEARGAARTGSFPGLRIEDPAHGRCGLTSLSWLPEYKLLIAMSGDPYEVYHHDPVSDRLLLTPDLGSVWSQTPTGLVLGRSAGGPGHTTIWNSSDGSSEPVILDRHWPYAVLGTLNADETAAALLAARSGEWEAEHGWQVFRRRDSTWQPAGPVAKVAWMNQPPGLLNKDGGKAWTVPTEAPTKSRRCCSPTASPPEPGRSGSGRKICGWIGDPSLSPPSC